jgi:hypothetical protein
MSKEIYVVLTQSEKDGIRVTKLSKDELVKRLNDGDYYGDDFLTDVPKWCQGQFEDTDHDATLILKCEVVVPEKREVVVEYDLP